MSDPMTLAELQAEAEKHGLVLLPAQPTAYAVRYEHSLGDCLTWDRPSKLTPMTFHVVPAIVGVGICFYRELYAGPTKTLAPEAPQ